MFVWARPLLSPAPRRNCHQLKQTVCELYRSLVKLFRGLGVGSGFGVPGLGFIVVASRGVEFRVLGVGIGNLGFGVLVFGF